MDSKSEINFEQLQDFEKRVMEARLAANTYAVYRKGWQAFSGWCTLANLSAFPATPETCRLFVTWCLYERKWRLETVKLWLSSVKFYHEQQCVITPVDESVRLLIRNAARDLKERPGGKKALTPEMLRTICSGDPLSRNPARCARDLAILLYGFSAGWRRSEIVSLSLSDLEFVRQGMVVTLGASKTDQTGKRGRVVGIPYANDRFVCPVTAMRAWLAIRGEWQGSLFCRVHRGGKPVEDTSLGSESVNRLVKRALKFIGENAAEYGAHSLRSGMITAAVENGASEIAIMQRTGQTCFETLRRYVRPAGVFRVNPLAGVL